MEKAKKTSYEDIRKQRIEENKKRMQEINLVKLAQDVRDASKKPRKQVRPRPSRKEMTVTEPRRSSRIAELPTPVYEEKTMAKLPTGVYEEKPAPVAIIGERRSSRISKLPTPVYKEDPTVMEESPTREYSEESRVNHVIERAEDSRVNHVIERAEDSRVNHVIERAEDSRVNPVMERAEDLKSKLENGFPSFIKPMTQSYLKGGAWLVLPRSFCKSHLPRHNDTITLVDENGDEYPTAYTVSDKSCLSSGWKEFYLAQGLVHGDALVFELIRPRVFKVYIVRVND